MRILFTGSSSFTGYWFIQCLIERDHQVIATFRRPRSEYSGVRAERVERIVNRCETRFSCETNSATFQNLIEGEPKWDLWCHHAADVTNYKSVDFDPIQALHNNCSSLSKILQHLQQKGCGRVLLTGSVFEQREGGGSSPVEAVSPYGLSKGLTSDVFAFYTNCYKMHLGRFIIPNPFGPFEEERLTHYLITQWSKSQTPHIATPDYIRDNIHVSLLAKAYARFAEQLPASAGQSTLRPSGYRGAQREFIERFAREMGKRLQIDTPLTFANQTQFLEPRECVNSDALDVQTLMWNEKEAWDALANYYKEHSRVALV